MRFEVFPDLLPRLYVVTDGSFVLASLLLREGVLADDGERGPTGSDRAPPQFLRRPFVPIGPQMNAARDPVAFWPLELRPILAGDRQIVLVSGWVGHRTASAADDGLASVLIRPVIGRLGFGRLLPAIVKVCAQVAGKACESEASKPAANSGGDSGQDDQSPFQRQRRSDEPPRKAAKDRRDGNAPKEDHLPGWILEHPKPVERFEEGARSDDPPYGPGIKAAF